MTDAEIVRLKTEAATVKDRSVPRARVGRGDTSTDRRGRVRSGPAILSYGFRPFFLAATTYAALMIPLWLWMYRSGASPAGPFSGPAWHAHEMTFGYLGAVIAGFVLTAVPNWTGRLPLSGRRLAILVALWVLGRLAVSGVASPVLALLLDLAFPTALAGSVWREVLAGRNWRNMPVAVLLTLFAGANLLHHLEGFRPNLDGLPMRLALGVAAMLIALIGGRVTPSFTRNWLAKAAVPKLPASFGTIDRAALAATAVAVVAWIARPDHTLTGALLALAGVLLLVRLSRWQGFRTWRAPIVAILHVGYLWLSVALLMLGLTALAPQLLPASAALHALTAGAVATMTLAVMTRATRGHTGRPIETDAATLCIYLLVTVGALLRVAAPLLADVYLPVLTVGGLLWSLGFGVFVVSYGPMLLRPKV